MKINLFEPTITKSEEKKVLEVLRSKFWASGSGIGRVRTFEKNFNRYIGSKDSLAVNSGTAALNIALSLVDLKGKEVIIPSLSFISTANSILRNGGKPVFVDVEPETYIVNIDQVEQSITSKTKALMIPSLLGNVPDLKRLRKIADDNNLIFVEDSADTLGATFDGIPTGKFSDVSTTSFYGSHIITAAGEGGMICCNNQKWEKRCRILRGWGRTSAIKESEKIEDRFDIKLNDIPYDSKFIFEEMGYNFLPTEISAAFGLVQLKKLKKFTATRQTNFNNLYEFFSKIKFFKLPKQLPEVKTAWLAFPLTISENAPFSRLELVKYLEMNGIQTRPIFTGNVLKQPAFHKINYKNLGKDYVIADYIMKNSFLIGCNHGLTEKHIEKIKNTFTTFLSKY